MTSTNLTFTDLVCLVPEHSSTLGIGSVLKMRLFGFKRAVWRSSLLLPSVFFLLDMPMARL